MREADSNREAWSLDKEERIEPTGQLVSEQLDTPNKVTKLSLSLTHPPGN